MAPPPPPEAVPFPKVAPARPGRASCLQAISCRLWRKSRPCPSGTWVSDPRSPVRARRRAGGMGLAGVLRAAAAAAGQGSRGRGLARAVLDAQVPRDVVLFRHDRARFFRFVALLCVGQGLFWAWLARLAYVGMRPRRPAPGPEVAPAPARDQPFTSSLWRYGFCGSCLAVGFVVVGGGLLFSRRSVRQVVLHRGGQAVTLRTHSPFGLRDSLTVPLRDVSCRAHRSQVPAALPVKVRGVTFYFLLDRAGQFLNPQLFDVTVGAYRKL